MTPNNNGNALTELKAADRLRDLANRYLYRDAFAPASIYDQTIIDNLLRLLAHQLGNEVSFSELAANLEASKETVMRYIDLLEKAFIVFRLLQFRKNQRVQIGRLRKIYFYDLGVRNALIDNLRPLSQRSDTGAIWENFMLLERMKRNQFAQKYTRSYYWRSRDKQEIDLVEEKETDYFAYEFKLGKAAKIPRGFTTQYPDIAVKTINKRL